MGKPGKRETGERGSVSLTQEKIDSKQSHRKQSRIRCLLLATLGIDRKLECTPKSKTTESLSGLLLFYF